MTDAERLPANSLSERIRGVDVFRWAPQRHSSLPDYQPENFGDSLACEIVKAAVAAHPPHSAPLRNRRLLSIGSILHFARSADTVWGSGINGKVGDRIGSVNLDVRAVRGPKTREALMEAGVVVPPVYGDPGLLLPDLFPKTREWAASKQHEIAIVPNFNDATEFAASPGFVNPLAPLWDVIRHIAQSEFVIASSLHAIIVAEALGVPVRPLVSTAESTFKYDDYALGTGRTDLASARSVEEALELGPIDALEFDTEPLLQSFPHDLWRNVDHTHVYEAGALPDSAALEAALSHVHDSDDEIIVAVADPTDEALASLRSAASDTEGIRLIGTPQPSRGARLTALLAMARGATVSILGEGEQRVPGALDRATDALTASGAALAFTRVQEYDRGPDEYAWGGPSTGAEATTLMAVPSLVGFQHPSGIVFNTEYIRRPGWALADRDCDFLLEPLVTDLERNTQVIALDTVTTLHRRGETTRASEVADSLAYFADILEKSGGAAAVCDAVLARIPALWQTVAPDDDSLTSAADRVVTALVAKELSDEQRYTVGLVTLAAFGFGDLTKLGFSAEGREGSPGLGLDRLAAAAKATSAAENPAAPHAASALLELVQPLARGSRSGDLPQLVSAIRLLEPLVDPAESELLAAAIRDDLPAVGILSATPGDARIDTAAQTPLGWRISGTVPGILRDDDIRIWVSDAGRQRRQEVGRLRYRDAEEDCRVAFTAFVRSLGAPSGLLELRPSGDGPGIALITARQPAGKFVHQMLHPIELPLDGGEALLVRRTAPLNAVLARYRQGR